MIADFINKYGWKTLVGTAIFSVGQIAPAFAVLAPYAPALCALGSSLGGIGLVSKLANLRG